MLFVMSLARTRLFALFLEPKTSRIERDQLVTTLLAQTSLESNASVNLVCVGIDGRPQQKSFRDILVQWIQFRAATALRRSQYRLEKVLDRIHVLEGSYDGVSQCG